MNNEGVEIMTKHSIAYAVEHMVEKDIKDGALIIGAYIDGYLAGCHGILTQKQQDESIAAVMKGLKNACK